MLNQEVVMLTKRTLGPVSKVIPDHIRSHQLQSRQETQEENDVPSTVSTVLPELIENE